VFGLRAWRRRRALARSPIDDEAWQRGLERCRVTRHLDAAALGRLRELVTLFLLQKPINGVGFELTLDMRLAIALQACVPILELGIDSYAPWVEVIVYPDEFVVEHEVTDEDGIVHEVSEPLAGQAWAEGPVILSWADIEFDGNATRAQDRDCGDDCDDDGYNVVLHEFAHKLDMLDGVADGMPPLHAGMSRTDWQRAFSAAFDDFADRLDRLQQQQRARRRRSHRGHRHGTGTLVADAVQETVCSGGLSGHARDADRAQALPPGPPAELPLDPYAATDAGEFFACASEAFFEAPRRLCAAWPEVYAQLARFYRQDPLA
jgi:MtfA peptidase